MSTYFIPATQQDPECLTLLGEKRYGELWVEFTKSLAPDDPALHEAIMERMRQEDAS